MLLSFVAVGAAVASRSGAPPTAQSAAATPKIIISMFAFKSPASVAPSAKIRVVNKDAVTHTVTSDTAGLFNVSIPAHSTATFKAPKTRGAYHYHCTIHATMHGVLRVK